MTDIAQLDVQAAYYEQAATQALTAALRCDTVAHNTTNSLWWQHIGTRSAANARRKAATYRDYARSLRAGHVPNALRPTV